MDDLGLVLGDIMRCHMLVQRGWEEGRDPNEGPSAGSAAWPKVQPDTIRLDCPPPPPLNTHTD